MGREAFDGKKTYSAMRDHGITIHFSNIGMQARPDKEFIHKKTAGNTRGITFVAVRVTGTLIV